MDCLYDFSAYGSECCDTAWDDFEVSCADLEENYSWDCSGCSCPGDVPCDDFFDCFGQPACGFESYVGDE